MIIVKTKEQIEKMKIAGRITGEAILVAAEMIREGVTTKQIDEKIRHHIEKNGAKPSFLGYGGFPGSACISINDEIIHGIPSAERVLHEGDIVKIDVGAFIGGFHGDSANTFPVGKISAEAQHLIDVTKESFYRGVAAIDIEHGRIGDIGHAIDSYVVENGMTTVKKYVGHGVGHDLHEDPNVPNYGTAGRGPRLCRGMTIAIEPMVCVGDWQVRVLDNDWTVVSADGSLAAHYENTILITDGEAEILTMAEDI